MNCEWCGAATKKSHHRFCSRSCGATHQHRTVDPVARFWSFVEKTDGCWNWTGAKDGDGYGYISVTGKGVRAHRYSLAMAVGKGPPGSLALHSCDNPTCVRPDHLRWGTNRDNARDASARGRLAFGDRNWTRQHPERLRRGKFSTEENARRTLTRPRGSNHKNSKLTESAIIAIRDAVREGATQRSVALKFGVSTATICLVVSGKHWKHVSNQ